MKSYLKLVIRFLCLACSTSSLFAVSAQKSQEVENGGHYNANPVWVGPGLYGGVWLNNESEYNEWHRNNYDNHRRGDDRLRRGGAHEGDRAGRR